jgi:Cu(I)/Ag(I) efflux system membrane fusion protein
VTSTADRLRARLLVLVAEPARRRSGSALAALAWTLVLSVLLSPACGREQASEAGPSHGAGHASSERPPAAGAQASPPSETPLPAGMAEVEVPLERRQLTGVRTEALELRPLSRELRTVGLVVADERRVRRIHTKVSGWVERLFVNFTGEAVREGQPILSIYSPELLATQREFLLALESASESGTERDSTSLLGAARSRLQLFDIDSAQIAELARTREAQRTLTLHSPITGFATGKPVLQGMYVEPGMELYTVADLSSVWIWADVTEEEISLVEPGQRARFEILSMPGARGGTVSYLQPTLDAATRTLRVRFDVDNADGALRPGMYATVILERPFGEVLALPEDAVIDTGRRRIVFVEVSEGRFQPREVTLGRKGDAHYEIVSGLAKGERVVVSAQFLLDSESRLRGVARPAHGSH